MRDTWAEEIRPTNDGSGIALSACMFTCVILLSILVASHLSIYYGKDNPVSPSLAFGEEAAKQHLIRVSLQ